MCCEDLVCASCARPVVEAGCPVCRVARATLHAAPGLSLPTLLAAVLALLALAMLLAAHLTG